jgi:rod shape-determining protein MreC
MGVGVSSGRKVAIVSFCLLCCSLLLTAYSARNPSIARAGSILVSEIVSPVQAGVDFVSDSIHATWRGYFALVSVSKERDELFRKIETLEAAQSALEEHRRENERLRSLLELTSVNALHGVVASVVGDEPSGWGKGIVVNKGSSHGVQIGMAVVHPRGVVGQVVSVSPNFSQVLLITDHASGLDAIVQESRTRGVVEGIGAGFCELKFVSKESPVRSGELLVTSGMDGVYPKGLIVGSVSRVAVETGTLLQNIEVKVAVDFSKLEDVLIVTGDASDRQRSTEASALMKSEGRNLRRN